MKLYATTTSERASKGQGGNKELDILIQAEGLEGIPTREQIIRLIVKNDNGKLNIWLVNYHDGQSYPIIPHSDKAIREARANKQKSDICEHTGQPLSECKHY